MKNKKSKINIDLFLELQKFVGTKLHYRDACNATVIEVEKKNDIETINKIKEFFEEKEIDIIFSTDNKYIYEK